MSIIDMAILAKVNKLSAGGNGGGGGIDTSDATATADDILAGATAYGADGTKMVGTIETEELPQPAISVNSNGQITATVELDNDAYVKAETKTATKTLTTQAAKTITPSASQQTAVASGRYTTGNVVVAGDADLKAENIKKGVSIFNVTGTYEGASGDSAGTATLYFENASEVADSGGTVMWFTYRDPATGERQLKHLSAEEPDLRITVPCGIDITLYINRHIYSGFIPFGWNNLYIRPEDGGDRLPYEDYVISYCPDCNAKSDDYDDELYRYHDEHISEDGRISEDTDVSPNYYVASFFIPKTYVGKTMSVRI